MIHSYCGITPNIDPSVFLAGSAEIIGDVVIGKDSSVWHNAVIRGDVNYIRIGERTNVQDGCLLHVRHKKYPLVIDSDITIGHGAILHACTVKSSCLIGMGAIVLDNAQINSYAIIGAGAVVLNDTEIPEGVLAAGVPVRIIRDLTYQERKMIEDSARNYLEYVKTYRDQAD